MYSDFQKLPTRFRRKGFYHAKWMWLVKNGCQLKEVDVMKSRTLQSYITRYQTATFQWQPDVLVEILLLPFFLAHPF